MGRERSTPGRPAQPGQGTKRSPSNSARYGGGSISAKILGTLVALALIAAGALWTFAGQGAATTFGPIVAGLGVALGYVVLLQKRR